LRGHRRQGEGREAHIKLLDGDRGSSSSFPVCGCLPRRPECAVGEERGA
jgi:hypothetical protein